MAIAPVTVTIPLVDFLGFVPDSTTKVKVTSNVESGFLVDTTTGGSFRLDGARVSIDTAGVATFSVLPSGTTGLQPLNYQIHVTVDARNPLTRTRKDVALGWYTITAACNLKDLVAAQYVPPTYLSTVTTLLDTYVTEAEAARDAAVAIAGPVDATVEALVKNTGGVGPLTSAALSATFVPLDGESTVVLTHGLSGNGQRFEVQKTDSPLNYAADTRAAFVVQQKDTQGLGAQQLDPGAVFQFESTGDGVVNAGTYYSESIWEGLLATMKKSGDGSGHAVTFIGELGNVGAGGYNELGGYQGTLTNISSTNGTMSGVEVLLKDSPDAGATSFDTQMSAVIGRVAKYSAGRVRRTQAFFASSEGTVTPDAVLAINGTPTAPNGWRMGLDLSGGSFETGVAMLLPNDTNISFLDAADAVKPILGVSAADVLFMRPATAAAGIELQTFAGATGFKVNGTSGRVTMNTTTGANVAEFQALGVTKLTVKGDGTLDFNSGITTVAVGDAGGASAMPTPAGYLFFYVGGVQKRIAYFN